MSRFLLLLGVSGVGKSSIIRELLELDTRFVYITPYMTRSLRKGEGDKLSIGDEEMDQMMDDGEFLVVNELYGVRYATPKAPIVDALANDRFPVLDWPIDKMEIMQHAFPKRLFVVYILPPSIESLRQRLGKDGRDGSGCRLQSALQELRMYESFRYERSYVDFEVVSRDNRISETARMIYDQYVGSD